MMRATFLSSLPEKGRNGTRGTHGAIRATLLAALLIATLTAPRRVRADPVVLDACVEWGLAARTGTDSCWARLRLRLEDGSVETACVPRSAWIAYSGRRCGSWAGRWTAYSPLRNIPPAPGAPPKPVFRILRVRSCPVGPARGLERGLRYVELIREHADVWLIGHGSGASGALPLAALRLLLTGTQSPGGATGFLGLLGLVHLCFASGLHLYALARLWDAVIRRAACAFPWIPWRWARVARAGGMALAWLAAWLLGGARPGMIRPWALLCIRGGSRRLGLRFREAAPWAAALGLELLVAKLRREPALASHCCAALATAAGLIALRSPVGALGAWAVATAIRTLSFGMLPLATPVISAIATPLFALILYPLVLLGCALNAAGLPEPASVLARWSLGAAGLVVPGLVGPALRWRTVWLVAPGWLLAGAALGAVALACRARVRRGLLPAIALLRLLLAPASASALPAAAVARVEQLDVGQGDAALVLAQGAWHWGLDESIGLIDSGSAARVSDREWFETLARRGIRHIDWIALTHLDEDHSGGVLRLARLLPIGCVSTAREEIDSPRGIRYHAELARLGVRLTTWEEPCVPFPALAPPRARPGAPSANAHMGAVFVPLEGGGFYLSAGDAGAEAEPRIGSWAHELAARLGADQDGPRILKISHHGSQTSSDPRFVRRVAPTEAWISVGTGNPYGHPSASVLGELEGMGIPVRRTDREGVLESVTAAGARRRPPGRHP